MLESTTTRTMSTERKTTTKKAAATDATMRTLEATIKRVLGIHRRVAGCVASIGDFRMRGVHRRVGGYVACIGA
jgi:hypothetical protein